MNVQALVVFVEPLALAGTLATAMIAILIFWRYRDSLPPGRLWRRRNWRIQQLLALAALFYIALAATSLVLSDLWGWLYLMLAIKAGTWWLRRALTVRPAIRLRWR